LKGIQVLEDCALSLGAGIDRVHTGLLSTGGCFSFYPAKHITTGEGGMLLTRNPDLAHAVAELRSFGLPWSPLTTTLPRRIGLNCRLTEMQAAMGIEQLKRLPVFLEERARNWRALARKIPNYIDSEPGSHYAFSFFPDTRNVSRETIRKRLRDDGIETAVYYGHVVPLLPYYAEKYGHKRGQFPMAERICRESLAFPVGPHLKPGDTDRIIRSYHDAILKRV